MIKPKKSYRKLTRLHEVYAAVVISMLFISVALKPQLLFAGTSLALIVIVVGNGYLQAKHHKVHKDTKLEYIVLAIAVFIILLGAIRSS